MTNISPELTKIRQAFKAAEYECKRCGIIMSGAVLMEEHDPEFQGELRDDNGASKVRCPACVSVGTMGDQFVRCS